MAARMRSAPWISFSDSSASLQRRMSSSRPGGRPMSADGHLDRQDGGHLLDEVERPARLDPADEPVDVALHLAGPAGPASAGRTAGWPTTAQRTVPWRVGVRELLASAVQRGVHLDLLRREPELVQVQPVPGGEDLRSAGGLLDVLVLGHHEDAEGLVIEDRARGVQPLVALPPVLEIEVGILDADVGSGQVHQWQALSTRAPEAHGRG